jgi:hypothetical protein
MKYVQNYSTSRSTSLCGREQAKDAMSGAEFANSLMMPNVERFEHHHRIESSEFLILTKKLSKIDSLSSGQD